MTLPLKSPFDLSSNVYDEISNDLKTNGFSINRLGIPHKLASTLHAHLRSMTANQFSFAGIGREQDFDKNEKIRGDQICWVLGNSVAGQQWLNWCNELKIHLNKTLYLGLFSFESHFAHYPPNAFYQRHIDAFQGEKNRIISVVLYLNHDWQKDDGGELVLYKSEKDKNGIKVLPEFGTLVIFLSEEFPHEVLPSKKDRFSIAGWYRVNCSHEHKIDPPL